jgi:ammonia channel protein AmtB
MRGLFVIACGIMCLLNWFGFNTAAKQRAISSASATFSNTCIFA